MMEYLSVKILRPGQFCIVFVGVTKGLLRLHTNPRLGVIVQHRRKNKDVIWQEYGLVKVKW